MVDRSRVQQVIGCSLTLGALLLAACGDDRCRGVESRFWPNTDGCDPACHAEIEGVLYDETRQCFDLLAEPASESRVVVACLAGDVVGMGVFSCHEVPGLGQVVTNYDYVPLSRYESCPANPTVFCPSE